MRFEQLRQFIPPSYTHFCLMSECVTLKVVIFMYGKDRSEQLSSFWGYGSSPTG